MDGTESLSILEFPMSSVSATLTSIDTVRALYQTVVSLRSALEEAKSEIQRLKSQLSAQSDISQSVKFHKFEHKYDNKINEQKKDTNLDEKVIQLNESKESFKSSDQQKIQFSPGISFIRQSLNEDQTNKMASKIDVKIKFKSNIKVESVLSEAEFATNVTPIPEESSLATNISKDDSSNIDEIPDIDLEESNNEKKSPSIEQDPKEEVDDIELIFSSEENKELLQEDLVSISEYDQWQTPEISGIPILLKYSSLSSEPGTKSNDIKISNEITTYSSQEVFSDPNSKLLGKLKFGKKADSFDVFEKSKSIERNSSSEEQKDVFDESNEIGGRKWTNLNVLVETDISKCGIIEETLHMIRRNTCPNSNVYYKPVPPREIRYTPSRLTSKYSRRLQYNQINPEEDIDIQRPILIEKNGPKRSSSAQTDITALPEHWKSESQLSHDRCHFGRHCTLPSKFVPTNLIPDKKRSIRTSNRSEEARRVLLSDINFTSMVPELSRSADHLCQDDNLQKGQNKSSTGYYKGNHLQTPDYITKGITPSNSIMSPCISQWTVNGSSFGTQTIQTGESWGKHADSFDSYKSYSIGSRYSGLDRNHRSRSVPSFKCAICKQNHSAYNTIKTSQSMHYTPKVSFQEPYNKIRGSLPDLRHDCICSRRFRCRSIFAIHGESSGSTESLLDEAECFVRKSMDGVATNNEQITKRTYLRRMSENDINWDFKPSKLTLPFLPKSAKCLKPGHLAKVISKNGRIVLGRVKYVGPLAAIDENSKKIINEQYVGLQLQNKSGDCDGTFEGRKFFDCQPQQGIFVPFKKVVMAWTE